MPQKRYKPVEHERGDNFDRSQSADDLFFCKTQTLHRLTFRYGRTLNQSG